VLPFDLGNFVIIVAVAVVAPIVVQLPLRVAIPVVVAEIVIGIAIGPQVLNLAQEDSLIKFLSNLGLAFLFFIAGLELDFNRIRGRPLKLASMGWGISCVLAFSIAGALAAVGFVVSGLLTGACLATTALGTLLPIMRDANALESRFGANVLAVGAVGEFGPIVLIALLLTTGESHATALALLIGFAIVAGLAALGARRLSPHTLAKINETMHRSAQLPVRLSILLIVGLVALADDFGLDIVLGGFAAGLIVGLIARGPEAEPLHIKFDAIGYGFLIPIFFITSGITFDLDALFASVTTVLRLPVFVLLFLLCRGLPVFLLYRRTGDLAKADRWPLALLSATGLPLIVAITAIGVETDRMRTATAAALVGAGMVSVFVYPMLALRLRGRLEAAGEIVPDEVELVA
jgi:Kef-type K+ transport system membrane component KefB